MTGSESPGGVRSARAARPKQESAVATLNRVRRILEDACEQDGQGHNLQESTRRKSYRAGINRALREIETVRQRASR